MFWFRLPVFSPFAARRAVLEAAFLDETELFVGFFLVMYGIAGCIGIFLFARRMARARQQKRQKWEEAHKYDGYPPNVFQTRDPDPGWNTSTSNHKLYLFHVPSAADDGTCSDGSRYYFIDKIRSNYIASDLGPEATITWKYNLKRMRQSFSCPVINPDLDCWRWGDTPDGIREAFERIAGYRQEAGSEDWDTGKKLKYPKVRPFSFAEKSVWAVADRHPIDILHVKYEDRRPKVPDSAPAPPPEEGVLIGMTVPPPLPEVPPNTPYYEYPEPEAEQSVSIPYRRRQTVYILGQPGKGKTTLMLNMIRQDMEAGKGVCVIDPHGDLAEAAARYVPKARIGAAIYFDPIRSPIAMDFFRSTSDLEREVLSDDLFAMFKRLTKGDGERMDAVLRRSFQLLLRTPGATFLDLYRLLTDDSYRDSLVRAFEVADEVDRDLKHFWLSTYPTYPQPVTASPILSRLQRFQGNTALRKMAGGTSRFSFYEVIRRRQILICNLSAAHLRGETKEIIGSLLVMQIHLAALRQGALPEPQRTPLYLYVDEFQTFGSSAFHEIIAGARKYGLRLTLANQFLDQLSPETRDAVRIAESRVYFRLQDEDARRLGGSIGDYSAQDLMNLNEYEAIFRPGKPSETRRVRLFDVPVFSADNTAEIIKRTQAIFPNLPPDESRPGEARPSGRRH